VEYAYGLGLVDPVTYRDTLETCEVRAAFYCFVMLCTACTAFYCFALLCTSFVPLCTALSALWVEWSMRMGWAWLTQ
jgi:hypothetical protein